jgi:hypothetical protein
MRRGACLVFAVGALTCGAAGAASPRLVVKPASPVAGTKATIELHAKLRAPVFASVRSPRGATSKVRLRHAGKMLWRGSFTFAYSGAWTVRARGVSRQVLVQAPLAPPIPASTFVPLGEPDCRPPSPANGISGEARGAASTGDLWAAGFGSTLAESQELVLRGVVNIKSKILWRIRGSGGARFTATAPDGTRMEPAQLQFHGGSNWNRPGDEWGSIFIFTQPGCWQIHVDRADNAGDLWLLVRS